MYDILIPFGLIILTGVAFKRLRPGGLDADTLRRSINGAVFSLFLPALCLKIVLTADLGTETFLVPAVAWVTTVSALLLALGVYRLLERPFSLGPSETGVLVLASTFGNVTYLGLPVLTGLYGAEAAKYAIFYDLLATTPLLWLAGASVASRYGEGKRLDLNAALRTVAMLPPIWGILAGVGMKAAGFKLPAFLLKTLGMFGDLVVPLMIFSIGLALSFPKVRHAYAVIPAVLIKLAVSPCISYGAARALGLTGTALSASIVEGAMPTMVLSLLLAAQFRLDVALAAFTIVVTTVLSFGTLPAAVRLAGMLAP